MRTGFIIFDRMTAMDLIGVYDPLTRLKSMEIVPDFEWEVCALSHEVADDRGLRFLPDVVAQTLSGYDLLVVPGGFGTRSLQHDQVFIQWIRTAKPVKLKTSVCTGSLLLGAAGFLKDKRATTHPNALKELAPYCASVTSDRIVDEGEIITAGGVTSSIDLGLYLVEQIAGEKARRRVVRQIGYQKEPKYPGDINAT
jgi:cyclohexyl-isocyanide hydratase